LRDFTQNKHFSSTSEIFVKTFEIIIFNHPYYLI